MKNKKILIVGSNDEFSLENIYFKVFKSIKKNVKFIHVFSIKKNLVERFFWKYFKFIIFFFYRLKLVNHLKQNKKKYDLIIFFKAIYLNPDILSYCKKICKKTIFVNIYPDDPLSKNPAPDISNKNVVNSIKYYDYYFIWSKKIKKKINEKYKKKNVFYLPFGNQKLSNKLKKGKLPYYDIAFIGTSDNDRLKIMKKLKKFKLIVAGMGWNKSDFNLKNKVINKRVNLNEMEKIYKNSKISLNILRKQNFSSHNMKTFEIPALGGLMLTKRSSEQDDFFPENKACIMYKDDKELVVKINKVISKYKEFLKIKEKGYDLSKNYSYYKRAKFILSKIK